MSAKLAPPAEGFWKAKGKKGETRTIPFNELTDDHLQRAYFVTQNKELEFFNKSIKYSELGEGLLAEGQRRGLKLRSITNEEGHNIKGYFRHRDKQNDLLPNEENKGV